MRGEGISALADALAQHRAYLAWVGAPELARRPLGRARLDVEHALQGRLWRWFSNGQAEGALDEAASRIAARSSDLDAELARMSELKYP